jgi:hypothetical protein
LPAHILGSSQVLVHVNGDTTLAPFFFQGTLANMISRSSAIRCRRRRLIISSSNQLMEIVCTIQRNQGCVGTNHKARGRRGGAVLIPAFAVGARAGDRLLHSRTGRRETNSDSARLRRFTHGLAATQAYARARKNRTTNTRRL